jgi:RHS repeat-associated protein
VSLATDYLGGVEAGQEFDPWGLVLSGGITATTRNYTGQHLDGTGLLYYNARYYDPAIGRFISADTVVPGNASGGMEGVAVKPLTVGFHETQFLGKLNGENKLGFWFQLSDRERQRAGSPWGPANPQALNRYAYVQNNPLKYTDPTGHVFVPPQYDISGWPRWAQQAVGAACVVGGCIVSSDGIVTSSDIGIGPAPLAIGGRFARAGINVTQHFLHRLAQRASRGITEEVALRAYNRGRLFYNPNTGNYIRYDSQTGVAVVVDKPTGGTAITVFEGNVSPDWIPVPWRPGS